mgnify:FL=1
MAMLYESIAEELESQIQRGELSVGDKLSERQLSEKYGVSRAVIREAMRSLAEKDLIETICGKGNFVTRPNEEKFVTHLTEYMDNSNIPIADIAQARKMIECTIAPDIVENADDATIRLLEEQISKMKKYKNDIGMSVKLDEEFHLTMLGCANNQTLILLTKTLNKITTRRIMFENSIARIGAIDEHEAMVDAIKKRDADALRDVIAFHISTLCEYL